MYVLIQIDYCTFYKEETLLMDVWYRLLQKHTYSGNFTDEQ